MTRAIRNVLHGPLPEKWNKLADAAWHRKLPYALLLASLFVFGCFPKLLTDKITHDAKPIADMVSFTAPAKSSVTAVALNSPSAMSN
jgi:NADH:ubiquinone oxidoreductase subunit 4 (subunit M)